jgi:hypothetical protein
MGRNHLREGHLLSFIVTLIIISMRRVRRETAVIILMGRMMSARCLSAMLKNIILSLLALIRVSKALSKHLRIIKRNDNVLFNE